MSDTIAGIHHITAIAGNPQRNLDFYAGVLGLRFVKRTVNFDDPGTYHFYFGDAAGTPGSILTFFPWPGAQPGRLGTGEVATAAFAVPPASLDFWAQRLETRGVTAERHARFDGETFLCFRDPDGLHLELVASETPAPFAPWDRMVPAAHAIRGFHSAALYEEGFELTARLLTAGFGWKLTSEHENRFRFQSPSTGASIIDLVCKPDGHRGHLGAGSVHHIAWRTPDAEAQIRWHTTVAGLGLNVTPVMDRNYFRSIYFREPGGVLFEIATDPPGFSVDEDPEALGESLKLPPWLEPRREDLEARLVKIKVPGTNAEWI